MAGTHAHRSTESSEQYRTTGEEADDMAAQDAETQAAQHRKTELDDETDRLLDEIDGLLEVNAAEFVAAYRQQGGE